MYIRRCPSKCLTAKGSLVYIIMSLCMTKPTKRCAPSENSDQPEHPPSLIRVFAVPVKKAWVLGYPLRTQQRLWSDWADAEADLSLRWVNRSFCWFCHLAAHNVTHVTTKPVLGVCDQFRLKPACSATETSFGLEISVIIIIYKQVKVLYYPDSEQQKRLSYCADAHADLVFEISISPIARH